MFDREHEYLFNEKLFYFRIRGYCNGDHIGIVRVQGVDGVYGCKEVSDGDRKRIVEEVGRMREATVFEPELDKVFEVNEKRYRCIKGNGEPCFSCSLFLKDCHDIVCSELERKDKEDVIFVEENG